ncbi:T6SS phospholipase effector Tle1-like catalytic domain-containing protein [Pedobacter sp. MW01-1-1]|uniref:T6SS phospholipase effector Tle1-like catalytic domain-containing protein n=1 Tax=Pedobacter sp. MW01-1-1 TaxID=3383027 RepID=UPI003FEF9252
MGTTYVYNAGQAPAKPFGELHLEFGLFFDGTLNNRRNTEIRKKVEHKGEFKDIAATAEEKKIYDKYAEEDNSFGNDFTNVARKTFCCVEKYQIYVEGMGTLDEKDDVGDGYKYGRGLTGIIGKVQKGCATLADRINKLIKNDEEIGKIYITIDAFGFSRGAAAARNFLYNLQKDAYKPQLYPAAIGGQSLEADHDGYGIENDWLKDGLLPPFGHLGTALLMINIDREVIDKIILTVRFLGVYDTVASYDPSTLLFPNFKKHLSKLHLNDIGTPEKAVHFTAADEHRKNFSVTRFLPVKLPTGIERNLPGVHSDVGGSYNHDALSLAEITRLATEKKEDMPNPVEGVSECEYIHLDAAYMKSNLYPFQQELIEQGWYKEEELSIEARWRWVLAGKRYLYRGYSFIPLHFMCDYAIPLVNRNANTLQYDKMFKDYALNDDFLESVKKYLKTHTLEEGKNWELMPPSYEAIPLKNKETPFINTDGIMLSEVVIHAHYADSLLKKLRNKYLHRSAKINTLADMLANDANPNRVRKIY